MRRTGKQGLHERVIKMDLKDLVNTLEAEEAKSFVCEGGYLKCPKCTCTKTESAAELYTRLGWKEPSEGQKQRNLTDNLDYYVSRIGK